MKLYHGKSRHEAVTQNILADQQKKDISLACRSKSVVDKTFFKPGLNDLAQVSGGSRTPLYDSRSDGSLPDYGVNIAWLRSKARDRVDIDAVIG